MAPSRPYELVWSLPNADQPPTSFDHVEGDAARTKQKKKAPSHVPRPPNAFILFRSSFIKSQRVSTDVETNHSTLSKIIGMTWQGLSEAERAVWHAKARSALEDHRRRFPTYAFRPSHPRPTASSGGGGVGARKKKVREVEPKDATRCAKIAELLVQGLDGAQLNDAIREFDKTHVPQIITRFDTPITESTFRPVKEEDDLPILDSDVEQVETRMSTTPSPVDDAFVQRQVYYPEYTSPISYTDTNPYPCSIPEPFPSSEYTNGTVGYSSQLLNEPQVPQVSPQVYTRRSFSGFSSRPEPSSELDFFAFSAPLECPAYLIDLMNFEMPAPVVPSWDESVLGF